MASLLAYLCCVLPALSQQAQGYTYDVVVIRPNTSGSGSTHVDSNPCSYMGTNVSLRDLIVNAYGLQTADQLLGLPGWAASARFDLVAKCDAETAVRIKKLNHAEFTLASEAASQALLADRFGLVVHHEVRELPEYALVQTKGGSKLTHGDEMGPKAGGMHTNNTKMTAEAVRLEKLTAFLANQVHRPVVDRTGLVGKFDVALTWSRDELVSAVPESPADKAPGLFTALQEQLGLKLESIKGPADVVLIDHLAQPTEN